MSQVENKTADVALSNDLVELANKISPDVGINSEGKLEVAETNFLASRPADKLSEANILDTQQYTSEYGTALFHVAGEKAGDFLAENPDIKRVAGVVKIGHDELAVNFNRPQGMDAQGKPKSAAMSMVLRRFEHKEHNDVRTALTERFRKLVD
ncbi:hypothetical protein CF95_gp136 [Erwinia phage PhiEaH1]|jgi:hypothetical protein|uniref:Uncharacterized protein n=1 Tax=Erwinia phage PhiEaH1 TaxID=1401669 RepID=W8D0I2_9CAUD|nr:hypothetical protein CF95_gp136 [Erwinia phage PhiEaH1]AGX01858.1 hypothetical protein [Erwinia phage PhiEaH1]WBF04704.1 hypothetical protein [Erwinia phage vB_Ea277G]